MTPPGFPRRAILLALALTSIVIGSPPACRAEPPTDPAAIRVTVKDNDLYLQGEKLTLPGELEPIIKLLGPPSRVVDDIFRYHIWDDFGIAAKQNRFRKEKITIGLELTMQRLRAERTAKKPFAGKLLVEGKAITAGTDLAALGKPFEQLGQLAIWQIPSRRAGVLFQTADAKGKGVQVFLYECGRER
jgi:hypothetical protein